MGLMAYYGVSPEQVEESDGESSDSSEQCDEDSSNSEIESGKSNSGVLSGDENVQPTKGKGKGVAKSVSKGPGRLQEDSIAIKGLVVVPDGVQTDKKPNFKKPNNNQISQLQSAGLAVLSSAKGDLLISRSWNHRQGCKAIKSHLPYLVNLISGKTQNSIYLGSDVLYPLTPKGRSLVLYKKMDGASLKGWFGSSQSYKERVLYFTPCLPLSQEDLGHLPVANDSNVQVVTFHLIAFYLGRSNRRSSQAATISASNMEVKSLLLTEVIVLDSDGEDADQGVGDLVQQLSQELLSNAPPSSLSTSAQLKGHSNPAYHLLQFTDPLAGYLQFEDVYQSYLPEPPVASHRQGSFLFCLFHFDLTQSIPSFFWHLLSFSSY
ncbi:hypothetical protein FRC03_000572 [Tulasnella sp. 419]|nr:hypothetical protein FRC03_000572 [Tulasnella sp. 419]